MIHTLLIDFSSHGTALCFQSFLFRETARCAVVKGASATINYRTKRELSRIQAVADIFNR